MITKEILKETQDLVNELISTNSTNEKIEILKILDEYKFVEISEQIKKIFYYTYNPYYMFGVTSKNCIKNKNICADTYHNNIFDLLDELRLRKLTGHAAIGAVNAFVNEHEDYSSLIFNIIDKNLKTRTDGKILNKVWNNLIPLFGVALAEKYNDHKHKINFENEKWLASRKMNGLRCICRNENGNINFYSRSGKEFKTLDVLKNDIKNNFGVDFVLDGEICLMNDGLEDFQGIQSEYNKKNHTIQNPKYVVFDILTLEEFDNKQSEEVLYGRLGRWFCIQNGESNNVEVLDQNIIKNEEQLDELMDIACENGWEGMVIRLDTKYKGKRSRDILKVKKFFDAEYKVVNIEVGLQRYISPYTGLEIEEYMMTRVNIIHKGNVVGVGSGWSIEQRQQYFNNPDQIIGKIITVQYKEETMNKKGEYSLQFPTLKVIHGDRREV